MVKETDQGIDEDHAECNSLLPPERKTSNVCSVDTIGGGKPSKAKNRTPTTTQSRGMDDVGEDNRACDQSLLSTCSTKHDDEVQLNILQQIIQQEQIDQRDFELALQVSLQDDATVMASDLGAAGVFEGSLRPDNRKREAISQHTQLDQQELPTTKKVAGDAPGFQACIFRQIQEEQEQRELELALRLSDDNTSEEENVALELTKQESRFARLELFQWLVYDGEMHSAPKQVHEWFSDDEPAQKKRDLGLAPIIVSHHVSSEREKQDPCIAALERLQEMAHDSKMHGALKQVLTRARDEPSQKLRTLELALRLVQEMRAIINSEIRNPLACANKNCIIAAVAQHARFKHVPNETDDEFRIRQLAIERSLQEMSKDAETQNALNRTHKEVVMAALKRDPLLLRYCYGRDKDIGLLAVTQSGFALRYACEHYKADFDIVMAAVNKDGCALRYASETTRGDKKIVMAAVNKDGCALRHASVITRGDKKIVMVAVSQDGAALEHAPDNFKADKEVVMAAVSQGSVGVLQYASNNLRADKEVVLAAVTKDPGSIKFALGGLNQDQDCWVAAKLWDKNQLKKKSAGRVVQIALSTKFSLVEESSPVVNEFTILLNTHEYIQDGLFAIYSPNAFNKGTCDPEWTRMEWPCRGTYGTCQMDPSLKIGIPQANCCWRYSYRFHLEEAKRTNGFVIQVVEATFSQRHLSNSKLPFYALGKGQQIEAAMAQEVGVKCFRVYQQFSQVGTWSISEAFHNGDIESLVSSIRQWYDSDCCNDHETSEVFATDNPREELLRRWVGENRKWPSSELARQK